MDATAMAATFNATHEDYARVAPLLWDPPGVATVRRIEPAPGERVLDACCGIGSSALPAARAVEPGGSVDAVDVAATLLAAGRAAAGRRGLTNIRFIEADVTSWTPDGEPYDAVQCVFGVFLLPDLDRDTAHLVGLLRDGGRLGVTVWAKGALETFGRTLYEVMARHRPAREDQPAAATPITRINTEPLLRTWLHSLGLRDIHVHTHPHSVTLTPDMAWALVLGTGFRGVLSGLDDATIDAVRTDLLATLAERDIHTADTTALIGIGHA